MSSSLRRGASGNSGFRPMRREGDKLHIDGLDQPIKVVDDVAAEEAAYLVCLRLMGNVSNHTSLPASRIGKCSRCGETVYWSAVAPKKPPRLCEVCFDETQAKAKAEKAANPDAVTDEDDETVLCTTGAVIEEARRAIQRADALTEMLTDMLLNVKPAKNQIN